MRSTEHSEIPPGWKPIVASAEERLKGCETTGRIEARVASGRLQLRAEKASERAQGILDGARAASGEICEQCGGKGEPIVDRAGAPSGCRCAGCRRPDDRTSARPWPPATGEDHANRVSPGQWSADIRTPEASWDTGDWRNYGRLETLYAENIALLMSGRDDEAAMRLWSNAPGWAGLLRAICAVMRAEQDERPDDPKHVPWRLRWLKAKFGYLDVRTSRTTEYQAGIVGLIASLSTSICQRCGQPGHCRNEQYVRTECDRCHVERPRRELKEYRELLAKKHDAAEAERTFARHAKSPRVWAEFERLRRVEIEDAAPEAETTRGPAESRRAERRPAAGERLELEWHAAETWREKRRTIRDIIGDRGQMVLTGGAVLAARLGHRMSADIDIALTGPRRLADIDGDGPGSIARRAGGTAQSATGRRMKIRFDEAEIDLAIREATEGATLASVEDETALVASSAQILGGKLARASRLFVRDAIDVVAAGAMDPEALAVAAASFEPEALGEVIARWQEADRPLGERFGREVRLLEWRFQIERTRLGTLAAAALEAAARAGRATPKRRASNAGDAT